MSAHKHIARVVDAEMTRRTSGLNAADQRIMKYIAGSATTFDANDLNVASRRVYDLFRQFEREECSRVERTGVNRRGSTFAAWCGAVKDYFRRSGGALPKYVGCDELPKGEHGYSIAGQWWSTGSEPTAWAAQFAEKLKGAIPVRLVRSGR